MFNRPLIFILTCLASVNAHGLDLRAAAELMYFDYEETDLSGNVLNNETGFIPGITLAASHPYSKINNTFAFSLYHGQVDYDGQTQAGQPHTTNTDQGIYRLSYTISSIPEDKITWYGKVYWQQWDRDILPANNPVVGPVSGLFERYQWWTLEAGIQAFVYKQQNHDVSIDFGILSTRNGTVEVNLTGSGFGSPRLDLGNGIGVTGAVKYKMELKDKNALQFGIQLSHWNFGRSNIKTISNGTSTITIVEPDSTTNQFVLSASYIYRF